MIRRAYNDMWRRAHGWRTRDGRWVAVAGLALAMAASCGTGASRGPAGVGVARPPSSHSFDGGGFVHDPTTTSTEAHVFAMRASRSLERPRAVAAPPRAVAPSSGDIWAALANCESHGRQDAYNPAGPYYSFFQWTMSSFHSAGGVGDPRDSDYATQLPLAQHWASITNPYKQWPVCWPRVMG